MNHVASVAVAVAFVAFLCGAKVHAAVEPGSHPPRTETTPANPTDATRPPMPMPGARSPVQFFRDLLAMSPVEREQKLAGRALESREAILAKLREYEALPESQRELRLRTTELIWRLKLCASMSPEQRAAMLESLPEPDRQLVRGRLSLLDRLPESERQALFENEVALQYLSQISMGSAERRRAYWNSLPKDQREKLEAAFGRLRALSPTERDRVIAQFKEILDLTAEEKRAALAAVTPVERQQIIQAMRSVSQLPPEKRAAYLRAVRQFAAMPVEERAQFLSNAERWLAMSAEERAAWRAVTTKLPPLPPLPPGFNPHQPPAPRISSTQRLDGVSQQATN